MDLHPQLVFAEVVKDKEWRASCMRESPWTPFFPFWLVLDLHLLVKITTTYIGADDFDGLLDIIRTLKCHSHPKSQRGEHLKTSENKKEIHG